MNIPTKYQDMLPGIVYHIPPIDIELTDKVIDATDLVDSIRECGQMTPIAFTLQLDAAKPIRVEAGNRRTVACKTLGIHVSGFLIEGDPVKAQFAFYASNVQRIHDPFTQALRLAELAKLVKSTKKARRIMGVSPTKAALLRSLVTAPPAVQAAVKSGAISLTAFKKMATASTEVQEEISETITGAEDGLSARQVAVERAKIEAEQKGPRALEDLETIQHQAGQLRALALALRNAAPFAGAARAPMLYALNQTLDLVKETIELMKE